MRNFENTISIILYAHQLLPVTQIDKKNASKQYIILTQKKLYKPYILTKLYAFKCVLLTR